jgi:hypothetical protein
MYDFDTKKGFDCTYLAPMSNALNVGIKEQPIHSPINNRDIIFTYKALKI